MFVLGDEVKAGLICVASLPEGEVDVLVSAACELLGIGLVERKISNEQEKARSEYSSDGIDSLALAIASFFLEAFAAEAREEILTSIVDEDDSLQRLVQTKLIPALCSMNECQLRGSIGMGLSSLPLAEITDIKWSLDYKVRGSSLLGMWQCPILFLEITSQNYEADTFSTLKMMCTRLQLENFVRKLADARAQAEALAEDSASAIAAS